MSDNRSLCTIVDQHSIDYLNSANYAIRAYLAEKILKIWLKSGQKSMEFKHLNKVKIIDALANMSQERQLILSRKSKKNNVQQLKAYSDKNSNNFKSKEA
ncbi:hypothetical protein BpHYR1_012285 [Brachionus plicatilis]|uniref:Uncharacterized protein n=1 Tax=Brachionus plicatilis TaxID=10195 RepID=A0A3M7PUL2_BRAPC|nr:hypothetical protein BpHYR1_012285 [Brachionus plicatilis]